MEKYLDVYNIRVRVFALLIIFAPAIIWLLLFVEEIRTLSGLVIITAILLASATVMAIPMRKRSNSVRAELFKSLPTQYLLLKSNTHINDITRKRYLEKLENNSNVKIMGNDEENSCKSAIEWLKSNYHTSPRKHLVDEENMIFGLLNNLYGFKIFGMILSICIAMLNIFYYFCTKENITLHLISFFVALLFIYIWIFVISKKNLKYAAEKYALALFSCLDSLHKNKP